MSSSPDVSAGTIAARNERGADRRAEAGRWAPREGAVLRGSSAVNARPYREVLAGQLLDRSVIPRQGVPAPDAVLATPASAPAPAPAPAPASAPAATPDVERRTTVRRAEDLPVAGSRPTFRLGEVYAEELERLRSHARAEGFAAGHAEGLAAADSVVAEAERAAEARLAEVQARWERRLVSATAALGAAARQLEEAALPVADDIRESILGTVLTLVEDLLGRELALAEDPAMDAIRRALTFAPADAPVVVRVHPDDLAEVPEEALAELPEGLRVVGDPAVERAGALAECGPRRIDAQLGTALARVQAVLTS